LDNSTISLAGQLDVLCHKGDDSPESLGEFCDEDGNRRVDWSGLIVMFIGILLTGVGNCCFYSFGVAYLDDNTSHNNSPIMLSLVYTFRLLGPTLGMSARCIAEVFYYDKQWSAVQNGEPESP
jgi:hypothetical protein